MPKQIARSPKFGLPPTVASLLAGFFITLVPALADDKTEPAKKDTAAALKPSQATLTAKVEPAEAKPGDTVSYKVTAKLDSGFHIYKYSAKNKVRGRFRRASTSSVAPGWRPKATGRPSRDPGKAQGPELPRPGFCRVFLKTRSPGPSKSRFPPPLKWARKRSVARRGT